ncbi:toll/interleukin-1 receptor domain-containing protein [Algoriphagus sp. SE2]|uniref:toll/interleukin-1 receptor domain-containing protein n=1 Tax=Algoriphagus sp. SE2 TaxID=3141536 RepID=UPI0031CD26AB
MTPKFEKDIFISYAHIDDESLIEGEKGWISEFHRSLKVRLTQLLGYEPKIWRDDRLKGNDDFSEEIIKGLNEIALLISIHSPRYVKSEWCVREVNEFYKVAETNIGAKIGSKSRIFKVIKTPIDLEAQTPFLQGLLGYEFFKIDPFSGKPIEFNKVFGKEAQLAYWAKLDDLAHDIVALLDKIKNNELTNNLKTDDSASEGEKTEGESELGKIFLAETSLNLKENRESVKRTLLEKGYQVLPDKNLPLDVDSYNAEVKEMISESILSIHMIGSNFGFVPEGTEKSNVQLQLEMANSLTIPDSKGRLIWMPPQIEIKDERQIRFVEELKNSESMLNGADLLISSLEDLEFAIEDKLKVKNTLLSTSEETSDNDGPKQIYLICDQADIDDVQELDNFLFDKGFDVVLPAFEGDQTEVRLDHQENLINCDAVLIYYGNANELWLRSKMRDLLKIAGYGRKKKLLSKTVCIANPMNPRKERFRSHELQVLKLTDDINASIEPFIKEIS